MSNQPDSEQVWDVLPIGHQIPSPTRGAAKQLVNAPAVALMALAILGGVLNLLLIGFNVILLTSGMSDELPVRGGIPSEVSIIGRSIVEVFSLICCAVILVASQRMRELRSFTLCRIAMILAMVPCLTPLLVLGIPFGIWGFVTLNRPEVADAFSN